MGKAQRAHQTLCPVNNLPSLWTTDAITQGFYQADWGTHVEAIAAFDDMELE
ncbi:hypothetical protein XM38_003920 [Halomicronema hongdechloris C2206]|uniref:Uncharacterized protein n=1 Tax=Halomicronema hongdechloris C2206 TaxID=1641165 RepID=A0A1Z3HGS3_9CYAN|nr:hypothetical protein XM38_003920 [Halomicronema hongdechloris C2206]